MITVMSTALALTALAALFALPPLACRAALRAFDRSAARTGASRNTSRNTRHE